MQVKCRERSIDIDRQGVVSISSLHPLTGWAAQATWLPCTLQNRQVVPQQRYLLSTIYCIYWLYLLYTLARSRHHRWWNGGLSDLEDPERLT